MAEVKWSAKATKAAPVAADHTLIVDSADGASKYVAVGDIQNKYVSHTATATAKDVVYMAAAGTAARAKGDAVGTVYAIGFATETKTGAACIIQTGGIITVTGKTFTPGLPVFISDTTAGDCTQTAPTANGHYAQMVGVALTATDVEINIGPVVQISTGTVAVAAGKTVTIDKTMEITCADDTAVVTVPAGATTLLYSGGALGTPASGVLSACTGTPLINPRAGTITTASTIYPSSDGTNTGTKVNHFTITALAGATAIAAPIGSWVDGDKLVIRIKSASAQTIDWTTAAVFDPIGVTLPTSSVASNKRTYIGFIYNGVTSHWDAVGTAQEA